MSSFPEPIDVLPHRPPFLFVDRISALDIGKGATGHWSLRGDEWFFPGHFPGRPIMPGVIMVEALAQAGAVAALTVEANKGKLALFAGIDDLRFKRLVTPGDELLLECSLEAVRGPVGKGRGKATVNGELAVRGTLTFALT